MRLQLAFYFRNVGEVIRVRAEIMKSYQGMLVRAAKPSPGFLQDLFNFSMNLYELLEKHFKKN